MISTSRTEELIDQKRQELGRITIGDEKFTLNKVVNSAGNTMYTIVEDKKDGIERYSCYAEDLGGMLAHLFTNSLV